MVNKLQNGDYVFENDKIEQVEYVDEIVQNIVLMLKNPIGSFYPNKDFGSSLRALDNLSSEEIICYARQAVDSIDGVFVKDVVLTNSNAEFTVLINKEERQVVVQL